MLHRVLTVVSHIVATLPLERGGTVRAVAGRAVETRVGLTIREQEIVRLVVQGCSNTEIAERLGLQVQTVKNRLCDLYSKTGTRNRVALALFGMKQGLT